ncbi:MAG: tandem-95 repeat protein [Pirellula sp.]|nr:tandem-95 repeat protein [Pirellula sp.]
MKNMQRSESMKQSARRFFRAVLQGALPALTTRKSRPIHFEPLETRQLMAGDFYDAASTAANSSVAGTNIPALVNSAPMSTSGMVGEGEDAQNLVEFAKALQQAGVRFFGADWCPVCNEQKKLFEDGSQFLPFIEMTNPDRTRNATAISEGVTQYPTWEFSGGQRVTGLQTLQQLSTLSGVAIPLGSSPTFTTIPNQTVLNGSPLNVPVDAYDPNGGPLTITVTSSNPSVISAEMLTNNKAWKISVNGYGDMVYRLFADEAPRPVNRIETLTNSGFYNQTATNKIIFHRVIDNFVLQAGDPTGTGSGGSTFDNFDDQFNVNLQHNRTGILSYAKSSDDTNDSQFFITEGPQRHLDFNHSIFGQLIEGDSVREGISRTPVNSSDKPINEVSINSASIFNDTENGIIRLKALAATGTSTITVLVADANGNQFSRTFTATAAADTANGAPFLNDITVPAIAPGETVNIQLSSQDAEGQPVTYGATKSGSVDYQFNVNPTTGLLSVTAPQNYTGSFDLKVSVQATDPTGVTTGDKSDSQVLRFNVAATISAPTAVDLAAVSDTGTSDSDNITNAASMQFTVTGTTAGATVNLLVGSQVVGTAVATGATTTITTTLVSQIGNGTQSVVAKQTQNGQTSNASPALVVVYDSTAPAAIAASALPTSANVGKALSVDLASPEEGQGLRYSLENAPAGLSIDATTGLMTWTPIASQIGPQTANLRLTDAAGNSQTQAFAILVGDTAKVSVTLQAFDSTNTTALTSASIGQEIVLRIVVNDLRVGGNPEGDGVFSAYLDLLYDSDRLELVGSNPLTYTSLFGNGRSVPDITVPGIVNELGAFSSFNVGPGRDPQLLGTLRMRVKAAGQAVISTNPGENDSRGFTIFKEDTVVPSTLVSFGTLNLPIGQNFIAANDTFNFDEDSSNNSLAVLDNDTIVAGSNAVLTLQSLGTPSRGGTVSIASDSKRVIYTPAANINGQETFTYTVRDQTGATASATVTVQLRAVNDNPVAVNDSLGTVKTTDRDVFIPVLANDTLGPDTGETLTVTQVGTPNQGGTVRLATGGSGVIYNPRGGFTGNETFTYTITDGNGGTSTATVTVTVSPAVPPPTVVGESFTIIEDAAAAEFNVLSNDVPAQTGDTLSITDAKSSNGTATITSNGTRLTFAPKANFAGQELVVYTVRSSNGGLANGTATFTVTPVNDAPNAVDDSFSPLSSPNQSLDVLANDPLVDAGDVYTITAITQPETGKGTVQIGPNGKTLLYSAPSIDFSGPVVFTYTVSDGTLTDTASVTLNVQNFKPRDVEITYPPFFTDVPVTAELVGAGSNSNAIPTIPTDDGVKISNVGPGDYLFSIPDLPFISGGAQEVYVTSAFNDSSSITPAFQSGTRDARSVDIRDFMGQNLRRGITSAVAANKESAWIDGQGDWKNFKNIKVSLNTAGDQLTVRATNPSNQNVQATLPVSDPKVVMRGKEGDASLFRIQAHPSELTFTPSTSSPSTSANSTTNNTGASGEGEQGTAAPPVTTDRRESVSLNPALVDQVIQQVKAPQRMIASSNASDSSKRNESKALPSQSASAPVNSNPISNGFRSGFRTR